jgi:hypothetical protein
LIQNERVLTFATLNCQQARKRNTNSHNFLSSEEATNVKSGSELEEWFVKLFIVKYLRQMGPANL